VPLGRWVLHEACRQTKAWQEYSSSRLNISVNISGKQLMQPNFVSHVIEAIRETGIDPASLALEITESTIMENPERIAKMLTELKNLNIRFHIDDFGTGYSSLSYIYRFPISTLKIDQSFISRIGTANENLEIVRAIISLAHNLSMEVIAEGLEKKNQASKLRALECETAQGFYFSPPLPREALFDLIKRDHDFRK
jgi:EAL domain-containing protein (putative c-di-GMP-specific phosphodiesterase class I)